MQPKKRRGRAHSSKNPWPLSLLLARFSRRSWPLWLLISLLLLLIALLLVYWLVLPRLTNHPTPTATPTTTLKAPNWGVPVKKSGCTANTTLQDVSCTPGDIFPKATKEQICTPGYASSVRNVSQTLKRKLYSQYGLNQRLPGQYVIDHLVPLQLGGSNDASNLWPERTAPPLGSYEKDRVETYLHDEVCDGHIALQQAQIEIAVDWIAVYNRMPDNLKTAPGNGKDDEG